MIWSSFSNDVLKFIRLYFLADCGRETVECFVTHDGSVGWQAMVTTSLNVKRDQIETKSFPRWSSNEKNIFKRINVDDSIDIVKYT